VDGQRVRTPVMAHDGCKRIAATIERNYSVVAGPANIPFGIDRYNAHLAISRGVRIGHSGAAEGATIELGSSIRDRPQRSSS
jgi:hypothetical protein